MQFINASHKEKDNKVVYNKYVYILLTISNWELFTSTQ